MGIRNRSTKIEVNEFFFFNPKIFFLSKKFSKKERKKKFAENFLFFLLLSKNFTTESIPIERGWREGWIEEGMRRDERLILILGAKTKFSSFFRSYSRPRVKILSGQKHSECIFDKVVKVKFDKVKKSIFTKVKKKTRK